MRSPTAWDLFLLCGNAAAFGWRLERWGNGDAASGVLAIVFFAVALMLAYRIWAMNRVET